MTNDEQIAALKQAYASEMEILFSRLENDVSHTTQSDEELSAQFAADLTTLNKAYNLAAAVINAQP
jgi:hypothetical protein